MNKKIAAATVALGFTFATATAAAPMAAAQPASAVRLAATKKAPVFPSCKALNKKYPHGVKSSSSAKDRYRQSGKVKYRQVKATVNAAVYKANKRLDADGDGIACER